MLVLGDWQWTDSASLDLWALRSAAADLRFLVTLDRQLPQGALERMRREIDAGEAERIVVPGLDDHEVLRLVRVLSGSMEEGEMLSARLRGATDGNPFFLLETLRHLEFEGLLQSDPAGGWRTPYDEHTVDYAELPIAPTVRGALLGRARALGQPALGLLEAASLARRPLRCRRPRRRLGARRRRHGVALGHAVASQLVIEERDGFRFAHDSCANAWPKG